MPVIGTQVGLTLDRIVLATDFSSAEKAAAYAQALAKRFSSSLTLANVVDLAVAKRSESAITGLPIDKLRHESAGNQERLLTDITMAGVRATARTVESHSPAADVAGFARQLRADLIVTGATARHGLSRANPGSSWEGIIRHASCPVLTIGPGSRPATKQGVYFQTVVIATDLNSDAATEAAVALSFAQDSIEKIHLCHVLDHPGRGIAETIDLEFRVESALERLIPDTTYDWCSPRCIVKIGEVAPHILELGRKVNADLIVIGATHSASWSPHFIEATVEQVLMKAPCPVMTVPGA